jgi:transcription elongation factor Elf1/transposase-like protein
MFEEFHDTSLIKFFDRFNSSEKCKEYLAYYKWKDGFCCPKCGHTHYWKKKDDPYTKVCKACRHAESVTANTLFHKVKFSLQKAFYILYEMSMTTKSCSSPVLARKYEINQKTAWLFMSKVRRAMSSSGQFPLQGNCEVDEILMGGSQPGKRGRGALKKKKAVIVVEKTAKGGIIRAYAMKIENFSSDQLKKLFDYHISKGAKIETDKWRGYGPLNGMWQINQEKSDPTSNFKTMHRFVQQLKSWIRGIYHHISDKYLQGYLDEFCFRLNRHGNKAALFDKLIQRMVERPPAPLYLLAS